MADSVYIHGLRAENFMRLELVELEFKGPGLEQITGKNRSGKSSLLQSIYAALGGKDALPAKPVKSGEKKAEVTLDLGDRIVKLRVKPDRSNTLSVETKDGMVAKSPQKLLDDLVGALTFDPTSFADMDPRKQAETLRKLVGLDTAHLDEERRNLYDERTAVNREVKMLEGQLTGIVVPESIPPLEAVAEPNEVDITALAKKQKAAMAEKSKNDQLRERVRRGHEEVQRLDGVVDGLHKQLAEAEAKLNGAQKLLQTLEDDASKLVDPDMAALNKELDEAKAYNDAERKRMSEAVARHRDYDGAMQRRKEKIEEQFKKLTEVKNKKESSDHLTERIDSIDRQKSEALSTIKFPLDGLSVGEDMVLYNDLPLDQASSAEQLQVSLAIAAALNPRLRVLLVRQGNDLDSERLKQVAKWAKKNNYQVLMERVSNDTPVGIVIEAGKVKEDLRGVSEDLAVDKNEEAF